VLHVPEDIKKKIIQSFLTLYGNLF